MVPNNCKHEKKIFSQIIIEMSVKRFRRHVCRKETSKFEKAKLE